MNKAQAFMKSDYSKKSPEELFRTKHPNLSRIIEAGLKSGKDFKFDITYAEEVISWYNDMLKEYIKNYLKQELFDIYILDKPFKIELVKDDINIISLRDYIYSIIGYLPIDIVCFKDFIIRTNDSEFIMDSNFRITKREINNLKYKADLLNKKRITDSLLEILSNNDTRSKLKDTFGANDSELDNLIKTFEQLSNSNRSDWQILKTLEQLVNFNATYTDILLPYLMINNEYSELAEMLTEY